MRSIITVSGVIFAHICVFILLVNGCRGNPKSADSLANEGQPTYIGGAPVVGTSSEGDIDELPPTTPTEPITSNEKTKAPTTPAGEESTYVVQKGDSLSLIAHRNGVSVSDLAARNDIKKNAIIHPGDKLIVPARKQKTIETKTAAVSGDIYVVQKGDILGKIARKTGVSVAKIKAANNLSGDNIRIGQKLVIPSKGKKVTKDNDEKVNTDTANSSSKETAEAPVVAEPKPATSSSKYVPEGGFGSSTSSVETVTPPAEATESN